LSAVLDGPILTQSSLTSIEARSPAGPDGGSV